jgi:hypothetical protein
LRFRKSGLVVAHERMQLHFEQIFCLRVVLKCHAIPWLWPKIGRICRVPPQNEAYEVILLIISSV